MRTAFVRKANSDRPGRPGGIMGSTAALKIRRRRRIKNAIITTAAAIRKMEVFERDKNISTMTITEVEINPDTSDKDFAPPSGYTIQDLSNMPGMPR